MTQMTDYIPHMGAEESKSVLSGMTSLSFIMIWEKDRRECKSTGLITKKAIVKKTADGQINLRRPIINGPQEFTQLMGSQLNTPIC